MTLTRGSLWLWLLTAAIATSPFVRLFGDAPGEDVDSFLVMERARAFDGEVMPSRSWGFALYETIAYPLIHHFGQSAGLAWSYGWMVIAVVCVWAAIRELRPVGNAALAGATLLAAIPLSWIAATTTLETSQGIGLVALSIWLFARAAVHPEPSLWAWLLPFVAAGFAAATRPDHLLVAVAFAGAIGLRRERFVRNAGIAVLGFSLATTIAVAVYVVVYGPGHFEAISSAVSPSEGWGQRVVKAALCFIAAFGVPFWIVSVFLARRASPGQIVEAARTRWLVFFGLVTALYGVRLVLLPDEVEYLFPWVVVLVITLAVTLPASSMHWVIGAAAASLVVQVHLFDRTPEGIRVRPGISPGVIAQERDRRLLHEYAARELLPLANAVAQENGCAASDLKLTEYLFEDFPFVPAKTCALTSTRRLAQLAGSEEWEAEAAKFERVIVHPLPTDRGWRRLLAHREWAPLRAGELSVLRFP